MRQIELLERAAQRGIMGNVLAPGRRVAALDAFVHCRARELAQVPPVDHARLVEALNEAMRQRAVSDDGAYRLPACE